MTVKLRREGLERRRQNKQNNYTVKPLSSGHPQDNVIEFDHLIDVLLDNNSM